MIIRSKIRREWLFQFEIVAAEDVAFAAVVQADADRLIPGTSVNPAYLDAIAWTKYLDYRATSALFGWGELLLVDAHRAGDADVVLAVVMDVHNPGDHAQADQRGHHH